LHTAGRQPPMLPRLQAARSGTATHQFLQHIT
jgi:hypothetical protein